MYDYLVIISVILSIERVKTDLVPRIRYHSLPLIVRYKIQW